MLGASRTMFESLSMHPHFLPPLVIYAVFASKFIFRIIDLPFIRNILVSEHLTFTKNFFSCHFIGNPWNLWLTRINIRWITERKNIKQHRPTELQLDPMNILYRKNVIKICTMISLIFDWIIPNAVYGQEPDQRVIKHHTNELSRLNGFYMA